MSERSVVDEPARSRYELRVGDEVVGFVSYQRHGDLVDLVHTEIEDGHEGEGLGSALASGVLDDLRRRGLHVRPSCPFIAGWIAKHPDYDDLVER
ncbi:MAG: GCN5-related N-acetyltransferase [Actinomycetia bacterium]|jgi:predicted GNAT family acetyltransferase|nr:GCN5-related N-acetyltransferase [Actinomycetes bacterium]